MSENNGTNKNQIMQPNQRTMWFSIAGVVVLVALIIITPRLRNTPAGPAEPLVLDETTTETVASPTGSTASSAGSLSYADAVEAYEYRITFDASCVATPRTQIVPVGTTVMLDNQSATPHTVTVGDKVYQVGAYKYRTAKLAVAGPVAIHCDEAKDVAALIVGSAPAAVAPVSVSTEITSGTATSATAATTGTEAAE